MAEVRLRNVTKVFGKKVREMFGYLRHKVYLIEFSMSFDMPDNTIKVNFVGCLEFRWVEIG